MEDELGRREIAKAQRRLRIIKAARDLIRETGSTDLAMRTLAQRAEVSLSTPYNLFGSKRAVVLAVLEDERDFTERFQKLDGVNAIDRVFAAHELGFSYYVNDPEFYQTLWRTLLSTTDQDETDLASPERREQLRAIWHGLVTDALGDGFIENDLSIDLIVQSMGSLTGGALLQWATGSLATEALVPTVGLGYALCLKAQATPSGKALIQPRLEAYQDTLLSLTPAISERSAATL